jgi:phospholipid/cholesterol/gamma-HCH transport system ATP-binding protein
MSIIKIRGLKTAYGTHTIHENLDLDIQRGEILALIGDSGCGKTTLLRNLLMLLQPVQGEILIFDQDIQKLTLQQESALKCRWGVMYQQGALFGSLTILENVLFPLREFTRLPLAFLHELAMLKIKLAGLPASAAHLYPAELSGGMKKRAALARAIAMDPEILFLDEPTAGLDPQSASALDELILYMREALGLTIVLVTHDLDSLWRVPDQVAFIAEKKVIAKQPIKALFGFPHPAVEKYFSGHRAAVRARAGA